MKKKQRKKFVGQQLGVTPKSWLAPKSWLLIWNCVGFNSFFYMSLTWASRLCDEKDTFSWFSNVFHCFWPCECMRKHGFAGWNTQQVIPMQTNILQLLLISKFQGYLTSSPLSPPTFITIPPSACGHLRYAVGLIMNEENKKLGIKMHLHETRRIKWQILHYNYGIDQQHGTESGNES